MAPGPPSGTTLTGMVKSYSRKGYGFIMCSTGKQGLVVDQDIYFSRESLSPRLQTADIAGETVTFEVHRFPDGKLQARNLRLAGDSIGVDFTPSRPSGGKGNFAGGYSGSGGGKGASISRPSFPYASSARPLTKAEEEDRSRDWYCEGCGERNFVKRQECFKCKASRPRTDAERASSPRRLSPHAGSRAMREKLLRNRRRSPSRHRTSSNSSSSKSRGRAKGRKGRGPKSRSRSRQRRSAVKEKEGHSRSPSASSSSSGSASSGRSEGARRRRRWDNSFGGEKAGSFATSAPPPDPGAAEPGAGGAESGASAAGQQSSPEVEKAKSETLQRLLALRSIECKTDRMKEWRALLREWHPDKNPDRVEVATAVFQFLQKGKRLLDAE